MAILVSVESDLDMDFLLGIDDVLIAGAESVVWQVVLGVPKALNLVVACLSLVVTELIWLLARVRRGQESILVSFHNIEVWASLATVATRVTVVHAINTFGIVAILVNSWHLGDVHSSNTAASTVLEIEVVLNRSTQEIW